MASGTLNATAGFYNPRQDIGTTSLWTSHLLAADASNAALIEVRNVAEVPQTQNGKVAYGACLFGNCCRREYELRYTTTAPFSSFGFESGPLNVDVSGSVLSDGPVQTIDANRDGIFQVPETKTTVLNFAGCQKIDYGYNYVSYSGGVNYRVSDAAALFARYSRGARADAARRADGLGCLAAAHARRSGVSRGFVGRAVVRAGRTATQRSRRVPGFTGCAA